MVCNRCHLPKAESQKIIENEELNKKNTFKDGINKIKNEKDKNNCINNSKLNLDSENLI